MDIQFLNESIVVSFSSSVGEKNHCAFDEAPQKVLAFI